MKQLSLQFDNLYQAIEFYLTRIPVRQKSQTIESIGGCKPSFSVFDRDHPDFRWSAVAYAFGLLRLKLNKLDSIAYRFWMNEYPKPWGYPEIAYEESVGTSELSRAVNYVKEALEDSLIDRDLMPMPDNYRPAQRNDIPVFYKAGRPRKKITMPIAQSSTVPNGTDGNSMNGL